MRICSLIALSCLCVASVTHAQEQDEKDVEKLESKAEIVKRAKFVDFSTELSVPLASLDELGARIDKARLTSNPVELAMAGNLLKASESLSGKKASLTSAVLLTEAVDLAKLRGNPAELAIVAKVIGGSDGKELSELAAAVSEASATEEGEASRDIDGTLLVINPGHDEVHVYVNGHEIGHVHGHSRRSFHVHGADVLHARDHHGHSWHQHVHGHRHFHHWVLHPPHHHHKYHFRW